MGPTWHQKGKHTLVVAHKLLPQRTITGYKFVAFNFSKIGAIKKELL
jgi:hypothetical protein